MTLTNYIKSLQARTDLTIEDAQALIASALSDRAYL